MSVDDSSTLRETLAARVAASPDRLAYADDERRVTYSDLDRSSRELAAGLQESGVGPGDHVALVLSAGVRFAELFWAAQRLGAVPCALNPAVPAETIARRARRIRAKLVVDDAAAAGLARPGATPDEADSAPGDIAYLQTTSGTSGEPRAAMVEQRSVIAYQVAGRSAHGAADGDVLVSWVPPWHDLGLVNYIVGPVHHGVPCHIVPPAISTIPLWFETIAAERGTMTGAPDFALRLAARLVDPDRVDLGSLRLITNGGEPVRSTTIEQFEARFGKPGVVLPGYGLAEATLGVTTSRPGEPVVVDARGNVSNGRPLDGVEVRAGIDPGAPKEILARGETIFAGYLDDAEATSAVLREGWLHTGDLGYVDADGLLYVLGRRRAIIKRGGALLAPRELEEAALEVGAVRLAAAVGVRTETSTTEEIVVMVEARSPEGEAGDAVAADVSAAIRRALGFAPERVLVVPPRTIPSTVNGKVRHARLQELLSEQTAG